RDSPHRALRVQRRRRSRARARGGVRYPRRQAVRSGAATQSDFGARPEGLARAHFGLVGPRASTLSEGIRKEKEGRLLGPRLGGGRRERRKSGSRRRRATP